MLVSRRHLFTILASIGGVLAAWPVLASLQPQAPSAPKARPYPNGRDPNIPPENDEHRVLDPKVIELQNQKELRADVAKLYELIADLKEQLEKTDPSATLSVAVIKKTQQVERLAKQIKSLAAR